AFALLWGLFLVNGAAEPTVKIDSQHLRVPAAQYLRARDRIVAVDGKRLHGDAISQIDAARKAISSHHCAGKPTSGCSATSAVRVTVVRDGREQTFAIVPRYDS